MLTRRRLETEEPSTSFSTHAHDLLVDGANEEGLSITRQYTRDAMHTDVTVLFRSASDRESDASTGNARKEYNARDPSPHKLMPRMRHARTTARHRQPTRAIHAARPHTPRHLDRPLDRSYAVVHPSIQSRAGIDQRVPRPRHDALGTARTATIPSSL
ncbi:hypothetical protein K3495_g8282 [Podosphaera aphanis]|nr:hypothetical protein K3495_g8282 [Podosphaera aphanis]